MAFSFEVLNDNTVNILEDGEVRLVQPTWPDGTAWKTSAEAKSWAEQSILALTDPTADFAGPSPSKPTVARPVVVDEEDDVVVVEPLSITETPAE